MPEFKCDCQLPYVTSGYVYAQIVDNDLIGDFHIRIAPKDYFHWDGCIMCNLEKFIPDTMKEVGEGLFEYNEDIDITSLMESIGIEFSQNLYDLENDVPNTKCCCTMCTNPSSLNISKCHCYDKRYKK